MLAKQITHHKKSKFQFAAHPWISLITVWVIFVTVLILVILAANQAGIPGDTPWRPLITPTAAHILVLFCIIPFVFQLPHGKASLKKYLDDIRLSRIRPFLLLLILGITTSLIMLLVLASNSFIFRLSQGLPINIAFLRRAIDLKNDLPPASLGYINAFPAIFEEVLWRGVMLVLFMKHYSARKSIVITSIGFGVCHLINLIFGGDPAFIIRQIIFGTALGFFYGFLVLRTNSLLPAMLFHYLVNWFIGSFTHYFQHAAPAGTQILYTLFTLPCAAIVLILYVKFFCKRWIPEPTDWKSNLTRSNNYENNK